MSSKIDIAKSANNKRLTIKIFTNATPIENFNFSKMDIIDDIILRGHTLFIESYREYEKLKKEYLKKNNIKILDFMEYLNNNLSEETKDRLTLSINSRYERYLREFYPELF